MSDYDSREDTLKHIRRVQELLSVIANALTQRGIHHDTSKLEDPERAIFDEYTPKLKGSTYGSDEYKEFLKEMKVALDHHYSHNSHHPEYYFGGVNGMSLLDVIEMFCDWKAATERHADGDISKSIEINKERFELSDQLVDIFKNTVSELNWYSENKEEEDEQKENN
jgi:hypothetical protein